MILIFYKIKYKKSGSGTRLPLTSLKYYGLQLSWPLLVSSIKNNQIPLPCFPSLGLATGPDNVPQIDSNFPLSCCSGSRIIGSDSSFLFVSLESLYCLLQSNVSS